MEITGQVTRTTPGPELASNTIRYFASSVEVPQPAPAGMEWVALRASYDLLGERVYTLAGKAFELVHWERNSRFCPACGTGMEPHSEISRRCPTCGKELFPAISPAIIVLICKGDSILLARTCYSRSPFMGLVAGFLETGESLEACVHREVFEETGLQIRNLRYFGNQPWPYPSSLMVGFIGRLRGRGDPPAKGRVERSGIFRPQPPASVATTAQPGPPHDRLVVGCPSSR